MCGIFGIWGIPNASQFVAYALSDLQHRGQEATGIVSHDGGQGFRYGDFGFSKDVFNGKDLQKMLPGSIAIGHDRYSTEGGAKNPANIQPFLKETKYGWIALCHNGNLTNTTELRLLLNKKDIHTEADSDSAMILELIAISEAETLVQAIAETCNKLEGSYSLLVSSGNTLFAVRDPLGIRPLAYAKYYKGWMFSSETCALDYFKVREPVNFVSPGALVWVNKTGWYQTNFARADRHAKCVFEEIYVARPDSRFEHNTVYDARKALGTALGKINTTTADVVTGVPVSAITVAHAFAQAAGIPYESAIVRTRYEPPRSFIEPEIFVRQKIIGQKLRVIPSAVLAKRVIVVDDSIVRGSTMPLLIANLRRAGAAEVHVRIPAPEYINPCHWGVDTPKKSLLISAHMKEDELCKYINADSLKFLPINDTLSALGDPDGKRYCTHCFTGTAPGTGAVITKYPLPFNA